MIAEKQLSVTRPRPKTPPQEPKVAQPKTVSFAKAQPKTVSSQKGLTDRERQIIFKKKVESNKKIMRLCADWNQEFGKLIEANVLTKFEADMIRVWFDPESTLPSTTGHAGEVLHYLELAIEQRRTHQTPDPFPAISAEIRRKYATPVSAA
eukprot:158471_1